MRTEIEAGAPLGAGAPRSAAMAIALAVLVLGSA
jgi:hypothetical protein